MNKKRTALLLGIFTLVIVAVGGFTLWKLNVVESLFTSLAPTSVAETTGEYQTSSVRRGSLALSTSGSGTVITLDSADLSFATAGTLAELIVDVGDQVTKGQVLAKLGDLDALELEVKNQELAVQKAQQTLDDLLANGDLTLAQAYSDMAAAQTALVEAQKNLHRKGAGRCASSLTQEYYFKWLYAQQRVDEWQGYLDDPNTGYGRDYILEKLTPLKKERDQAYANYTYCQRYTDEEIVNSEAALAVAQAAYDQAVQAYQDLQAVSGVDPQEVSIAEAELESAKQQLVQAQDHLAGTVITATMDGTVMTVNGEVGDEISTGAFITIADLEHPMVQMTVDEADLKNFAVGCAANITFDSLAGENFPGVVTEVSPTLLTVRSVAMVEGLVDLEQERSASGKLLPLGLQGVVEITCNADEQVLYVPSQAVYSAEDGSSYVYMLDESGVPVKRTVAVGVKTVVSAEIQDGLSEGEKIVISQIEEK